MIDTIEKRLRMRAILLIRERFDVKRNARVLRVYKIFCRYTFVGQRCCIYEDIMKELA
jgi:hypothetical protein